MSHDSAPKKVIRVIARLNVGGPAIHVILLTAGLNPQKFQTLLVSGREAPEEGNMLDLAAAKGVTPFIIPDLGRELHPLRDLQTFWQLYRLFRRERPDIVHTHTAKAGTVGRLAAWLAGVPVIVHTFHGHVLYGYFSPAKTAFFRFVERALARISTRIIAVSACCGGDLLDYKITGSTKLQCIPLGLELDRFRQTEPGVREQVRREFGAPPEAFLVGMIARMVPIKRHEDLFRAIPAVLEKHPDTYFAVVGDGERRPALEKLAEELRIRHRCLFVGFRQDQERVYQALDLVVLTSGNEGLPVAVIEALSSGKPVVATRVGGVPELVEDGVTGYLAEPYNVESISQALLKAVANPEKTRRMGTLAQAETIRKFSISRLIGDIEKLYEELLKP